VITSPYTPGNPQALLLYRTNLDKFFHHAEKWTKKYAMQNNVIQQIRNTLSLAINKNKKAPSLSTFGWKILVLNVTIGGLPG
jgi:hypothetical protein